MSGSTWHVRDDPGLQPERTELAWQRTMITFLAASLLLMRFVDRFGGVIIAMVALAYLGAGYTLVRAHRRVRLVAPTFPERRIPAAVVEVLTVTALTALLGLLGLWVVVDLAIS